MISIETWEKTAADWIRQCQDFATRPDYTEWNTRSFIERLIRSMEDAIRQSRR